jgi:hypothetical protein
LTDTPRLILPNTGRQYDPNVAQDHTGIQFTTRGAEDTRSTRRDPAYDPGNFIKNPKWYACACGKSNRFRILTETDPMGDGCSQIICDVCKRMSKVIQFSQPQMTEWAARRLGIYVPEVHDPILDLDLDLPTDY